MTKPSSQSVKAFLSKIQETIDRSGSLTAGELIRRLNQRIKGWTMYKRDENAIAVVKRVIHDKV